MIMYLMHCVYLYPYDQHAPVPARAYRRCSEICTTHCLDPETCHKVIVIGRFTLTLYNLVPNFR